MEWKACGSPCLATAKTVADVKCGMASSDAAARNCRNVPIMQNDHSIVCVKKVDMSLLWAGPVKTAEGKDMSRGALSHEKSLIDIPGKC